MTIAAQLAMLVDQPAGPPITLRDYQRESVEAVLRAEARGIRRTVVHAATGLGKTVVACDLIARRNTRTLFLAHRDELIGQAVKKLRRYWPDVDIGVVKAERDEQAAQVVVASVQSLHERRLARFPRDFGLVVADECHHAIASGWRRIFDHLGCSNADGPLLVGLTATPNRGDGRGLNQVFQEIVASYPLLWGIQHGYLSDLRARQVLLDLDLGDVKVTRGDYDDGQLGRIMDAANAPEHVVKAWEQESPGRKTLVFAPTVQVARDIALTFEGLGVPTGFVYDKTPIGERRRVLEDFDAGRLQVLSNVGIASEGFDCPSIETVVIARPTKSALLYEQMIGRGVRKHPGKDHCLILDVVGATGEHGLVTLPSLLGLPVKALRTMSVAEAAALAELDKLRGNGEDVSGSQLADGPQGTLVAKDVDLFASARLAWLPLSAGRFALPVKDGAVCLQPTNYLDGTWTVVETSEGGGRRVLREGVSLEFAQGVGEDRVRECGAVALVHRHATWRKKPAGDKQRRAIANLGIALTDDLTAGEASDHITIRRLERTLRLR